MIVFLKEEQQVETVMWWQLAAANQGQQVIMQEISLIGEMEKWIGFGHTKLQEKVHVESRNNTEYVIKAKYRANKGKSKKPVQLDNSVHEW